MVRNILSILLLFVFAANQAQSAGASLFGISADKRLMSSIEKLGTLENGLIVYSLGNGIRLPVSLIQGMGPLRLMVGFSRLGLLLKRSQKCIRMRLK